MHCNNNKKAHVIEANYFSMIRRGYLGKSIKIFQTRIHNEILTLWVICMIEAMMLVNRLFLCSLRTANSNSNSQVFIPILLT